MTQRAAALLWTGAGWGGRQHDTPCMGPRLTADVRAVLRQRGLIADWQAVTSASVATACCAQAHDWEQISPHVFAARQLDLDEPGFA